MLTLPRPPWQIFMTRKLPRPVQVWNPRTGVCTATVNTGYGLSLLWAPGNRHAIVGTKVRKAGCSISSLYGHCHNLLIDSQHGQVVRTQLMLHFHAASHAATN